MNYFNTGRPFISSTISLSAALVILLFTYTALSKLLIFGTFQQQMYAQAIPHWLASGLIWTLPGLELLTAALLLFDQTRLAGFYIAAFLMTAFTGYILMVLTNAFGRTPCACGGVLKSMGWRLNFWFNIIFLLLIFSAIYLTNRERRLLGKE